MKISKKKVNTLQSNLVMVSNLTPSSTPKNNARFGERRTIAGDSDVNRSYYVFSVPQEPSIEMSTIMKEIFEN